MGQHRPPGRAGPPGPGLQSRGRVLHGRGAALLGGDRPHRPDHRRGRRVRLAYRTDVVLGGAAANLTDRAGDGVVTDYLHTGWWPTFNLADVFIVCGGLAMVALSWRHTDHERDNTPVA